MNDEFTQQIDLPLAKIQSYCDTLPIKRLSLFGSILRDDFTVESDVDMLVEYESRAIITLLDMASQEIALSELLGRKVDLRTANELSPHFRQSVLDSAYTIYELGAS